MTAEHHEQYAEQHDLLYEFLNWLTGDGSQWAKTGRASKTFHLCELTGMVDGKPQFNCHKPKNDTLVQEFMGTWQEWLRLQQEELGQDGPL